MLVEKVRLSNHDHVEALLVTQERRIMRAFLNFVREARSTRTEREIRQLLAVNDIQRASAVVDSHVAAFSNVLPQAFVDAATKEVNVASAKLTGLQLAKALPQRRPVARVAAGFDASNARAASIMRNSKLRFVQQFTNGQRDTTRAALATSFGRGEGVRQAARAFKDSIGLTRTQQQAVDNYRFLLENGSKEALTRQLRDRRFDRAVERASTEGEPLTPEQIDRMVDRYREKYIMYRAEAISRTEALRVLSEARQEALEQTVDQLGIDPALVRRIWRATRDNRTRDSHEAMQGQEVGLHEAFTSGLGNKMMYPGDGPAADVIHCRCSVDVDIQEAP